MSTLTFENIASTIFSQPETKRDINDYETLVKLDSLLPENPERERKLGELLSKKNEKVDLSLRCQADLAFETAEAIGSFGFVFMPPESLNEEVLEVTIVNFFRSNASYFGYPGGQYARAKPNKGYLVEARPYVDIPKESDWKEASNDNKEDVLRLLALSGVDFDKMTLEIFDRFYKQYAEAIKELVDGTFNINVVEDTFLSEAKDIYAREFIETFDETCAGLTDAKEEAEFDENLDRFLEMVKAAGVFVGFRGNVEAEKSVADIYFDLIARKDLLSRARRQSLLDVFEQNDQAFVSTFGGQARERFKDAASPYGKAESKARGVGLVFGSEESFTRFMFGLSDSDVLHKRERNWGDVNDYIRDLKESGAKELTLQHLKDLKRLSSRGLLPSYTDDFRSEITKESSNFKPTDDLDEVDISYVTVGKKKYGISGAPALEVEDRLQNLLDRTNNLISKRLPKPVFEIQMALNWVDYVIIHPHLDGNGTASAFFVEAVKAMRGDYEIPKAFPLEYAPIPNLKGKIEAFLNPNEYRLIKAFEGNPFALLVAHKGLRDYENEHLASQVRSAAVTA